MLGSRAPKLRPEVSEDAEDVRDEKVALLRGNAGKHVKAGCSVGAGRVEVDEVAGAITRDVIEQLFDEITVWVKHRDTLAVVQIFKDKVSQERTLSGTALTKDVNVSASCVWAEGDRCGTREFSAQRGRHRRGQVRVPQAHLGQELWCELAVSFGPTPGRRRTESLDGPTGVLCLTPVLVVSKNTGCELVALKPLTGWLSEVGEEPPG